MDLQFFDYPHFLSDVHISSFLASQPFVNMVYGPNFIHKSSIIHTMVHTIIRYRMAHRSFFLL